MGVDNLLDLIVVALLLVSIVLIVAVFLGGILFATELVEILAGLNP